MITSHTDGIEPDRGSIWVSDPPYQTTIWASKPRPAAKKIIGSKGRSSEDENANCCDYYKLQVYGCCAPLSLSVCESCRKVRVPPMSAGSQGVSVTCSQYIDINCAPTQIKFLKFQRVCHYVCHGRRGLRGWSRRRLLRVKGSLDSRLPGSQASVGRAREQ